MRVEHMGSQHDAELDEVIRMVTNIEQLIQELCPNGVPFLPLGDLARIRNGKDYKSYAEGAVPVYGTGGVIASIETSVHSGPSVLIPRKGSLNKLYYVDSPFWTVDTIFYTEIGENLLPKFFYYYLLTCHLEDLNQAGGVPSLTQTILNKIAIPVPPVEVQEEIVRILDLFTTLEAELEAELEKRVAQYAHYRSAFISQAYDKESVPLSDYVEFLNAKAHERLVTDQGDIPLVTARFISRGGEANRFIPKSDVLTMAEKDDVLVVMSDLPNGKALARTFLVDKAEAYAVNQRVGILRVKDRSVLDPHFLSYVVERNPQLIRYDNGSDQTHLKKKYFLDMKIPAISVDEQRRIAGILDQMDALVNDLSSGLPAEIAARRKQYEYYRDRLLSFPELTEAAATASPNTQEPTRP